MRIFTALLMAIFVGPLNAAEYKVVDDLGRTVLLQAEPQRIVSLAPHLTEILFSLGVGDRVVATVRYSDYPEAAKAIPRLGDAFSLSIEAILDVDPDLILAWSTGGNHRTLLRLKDMGYPVYQNEAANLNDIADTAERLGRLVGRKAEGLALAASFRQELADIRSSNQLDKPTSVFFQISDNQLYTVNNEHLIGQGIAACGGRNIFGELSLSVPMVSLESVLDANPEVILIASPHEGFKTRWLEEWGRLGWHGRIRYIDASLITRPGLRMLDGINFMCDLLKSHASH